MTNETLIPTINFCNIFHWLAPYWLQQNTSRTYVLSKSMHNVSQY